jgi:hypothetical protein
MLYRSIEEGRFNTIGTDISNLPWPDPNRTTEPNRTTAARLAGAFRFYMQGGGFTEKAGAGKTGPVWF